MSSPRDVLVVSALVAASLAAFAVQWATREDDGWGAASNLCVQIVFAAAAGMMWLGRDSRGNAVRLAVAGIAIGAAALESDVFWEAGWYWNEIGYVCGWLYLPLVASVLVAYPAPRPSARSDRWFVVACWIWAIHRVPAALLWSPEQAGATGPGRWVTVYANNEFQHRFLQGTTIPLLLLVGWMMAIQSRRWRKARGTMRTAVRLVAGAGFVLAAGTALRAIAEYVVAWGWIGAGVETALQVVQGLAAAGAAATLLVLAIRAAVLRSALIEELLAAAGNPTAVQLLLRRQLLDPTLVLRYRLDDVWYDADGRQHPLGIDATQGRVVQRFSHSSTDAAGEPTVCLDADVALLDDPERLRVTMAAAAVVLDNTRLQVERSAHLADLAATQTRIVEAGITQRRRLERDLHDGAQQSLLGVAATLSRAGLSDDPATVKAVVDDAQGQLSAAIVELRQLGRGIHPASLAQTGLGAALASLPSRFECVDLELAPEIHAGMRLSPAVESTAYFVVSEAVTNAVKHAHAGPIAVRAGLDAGDLVVTVTDDGPGGAHLVPGGGLAGLADRVRALGGQLDIEAVARSCVRARLPLAGD